MHLGDGGLRGLGHGGLGSRRHLDQKMGMQARLEPPRHS